MERTQTTRDLPFSGSILQAIDMGKDRSSHSTLKPVRLTGREWTVLRHISEGHGSQGTAARLSLSKRTVEFYLARVYNKLDASNQMQAIRAGWRLGVLPFEPPAVTGQRC